MSPENKAYENDSVRIRSSNMAVLFIAKIISRKKSKFHEYNWKNEANRA